MTIRNILVTFLTRLPVAMIFYITLILVSEINFELKWFWLAIGLDILDLVVNMLIGE